MALVHLHSTGIARLEGSVFLGYISEQSWPYASFIGTVITRAGRTHGDIELPERRQLCLPLPQKPLRSSDYREGSGLRRHGVLAEDLG